MNDGAKRWAPVATIVAAAILVVAAPSLDLDPPPGPGEPILEMAALFLLGFVLLPVTGLLTALSRAPRFRWGMASFSVLIAVLLVAAP